MSKSVHPSSFILHPLSNPFFCGRKQRLTFWIPLALLLALSALFRFTDLDLIISRQFFYNQSQTAESAVAHWPLKAAQPWKALYDLGVYPAWIMGLGGLLVSLASFFWSKLKPFRNAGLFLALLLALGPGLLVNGIFKPYGARPRPRQTIPFSGQQVFLPVGTIGTNFPGESFPSGHASMGFYLMAPGFVLFRRRPGWAVVFFSLGLAAGTIIGLARIVAGAHFASDVIWAAGIVYFTGLGLSALFRFDSRTQPGVEY